MGQVNSLAQVREIIANYDREHRECPVEIRRRELREAQREQARDARAKQFFWRTTIGGKVKLALTARKAA